MPRMLKTLPLPMAIVALIIFATLAASCGSSNTRARFVNAIADTNSYANGALDIEINNTKYFTDVTFGAASGSSYVSVPSASDSFEGFENPADTTAVFTSNASLSGGNKYTVVAFASGSGGNVTLMTPVDTTTVPANGSVEFRVIDASPSGGNVDIYIIPNGSNVSGPGSGVTPTVSNLAVNNTSSYVTVPYNSAGSGWTMYVCPTGTTNVIFGQTIASFGGSTVGSIRTFVLTDQANSAAINTTAIELTDLN